jgi:hypothetical protein
MTLKERLVARLVELAADKDSGWEVVPGTVGATIRYTKTETTPDYARSSERGAWRALWDQDTYDTHVFVTLVAGKFIMRSATAPWVQCHDTDVPLWLVEKILEDPSLGLDTGRQLELKAARKAPRS